MADSGRTWLVGRAERLYGPQLGRLQHSELSWNINWKLLPWFVAAGFVFGTIAEFTGQPTSSRSPGLFSNLPLYVVASLLTGLLLWALTFLWSFRRLLVFDRGLLYRYSQKHAARAILWQDIEAGTLRVVMAPAGTDADLLLKTLAAEDKIPLGVRGRYAVVFRGTDTRLAGGGSAGGRRLPRFFTFTTRDSPELLVGMIQRGLAAAGVPDAEAAANALPPVVVSSSLSLD